MPDSIISIGLSIIAAFLYDILKNAYLNKKNNFTSVREKYSKAYVRSVKIEFYVGFFLGILFISIPNTKWDFLNILLSSLSYFLFFIALMGFMCLVDVVNHFFDTNTKD